MSQSACCCLRVGGPSDQYARLVNSAQVQSSPLTVRRSILSMCVLHLSVIVLSLVLDAVDTATIAANKIRQTLE
jgi:hypothetical protein